MKCKCENSRGSVDSWDDDGLAIRVCADCGLKRFSNPGGTFPGKFTKGEWEVFHAEEAEDLVTLDDQPRPDEATEYPCCECGKESDCHASFDKEGPEGQVEWLCKLCTEDD